SRRAHPRAGGCLTRKANRAPAQPYWRGADSPDSPAPVQSLQTNRARRLRAGKQRRRTWTQNLLASECESTSRKAFQLVGISNRVDRVDAVFANVKDERGKRSSADVHDKSRLSVDAG